MLKFSESPLSRTGWRNLDGAIDFVAGLEPAVVFLGEAAQKTFTAAIRIIGDENMHAGIVPPAANVLLALAVNRQPVTGGVEHRGTDDVVLGGTEVVVAVWQVVEPLGM